MSATPATRADTWRKRGFDITPAIAYRCITHGICFYSEFLCYVRVEPPVLVAQASDLSHKVRGELCMFTSLKVDFLRNWLQMIRSDASPISAKMIQLLALRDAAILPLIINDVR
jgi:hypothetical protein